MSCDGLSANTEVNKYRNANWGYTFGYGNNSLYPTCIPMSFDGTAGTKSADPNPKINYIWQQSPNFGACSKNTTNTVSYTDPNTGITSNVYCVWYTSALPAGTIGHDITATGITVPSGKTYKFYYGSGNVYVTKIANGGTTVDVASFGLPSNFYCPYDITPTIVTTWSYPYTATTINTTSCDPTKNRLWYEDITPITVAPTAAPTMAPITAAPTAAPITAAPITAAPITAAPITAAPITAAPITAAPITAAPITAAPTMAPSPVPYSYAPTMAPTMAPSPVPYSYAPTMAPTMAPITAAPFSYETGASTTLGPDIGASTTDISGDALKNGFIPGLNNTDSIIVLVVIILLIVAAVGTAVAIAKKYK